jgi:hypothetical protein
MISKCTIIFAKGIDGLLQQLLGKTTHLPIFPSTMRSFWRRAIKPTFSLHLLKRQACSPGMRELPRLMQKLKGSPRSQCPPPKPA